MVVCDCDVLSFLPTQGCIRNRMIYLYRAVPYFKDTIGYPKSQIHTARKRDLSKQTEILPLCEAICCCFLHS